MSMCIGTALILVLRVVDGGSMVEGAVVAAGIQHSNPEVDIDIHSAANILRYVRVVSLCLRCLEDTQSIPGIESMVA